MEKTRDMINLLMSRVLENCDQDEFEWLNPLHDKVILANTLEELEEISDEFFSNVQE